MTSADAATNILDDIALLLGNPRLHGRPDMGCYECRQSGFMLLLK